MKPHIAELKQQVESRIGHPLKTPADFDALNLALRDTLNETLAASTLKRLWGYIEGWQVPRISTLDILARYIGHESFRSFSDAIERQQGVQSGFPEGQTLHSSTLPEGAEIILEWLPDRKVSLRHTGHNHFLILESINSKLKAGQQLTAPCFIQGQPLFADITDPEAATSRPYLAGKDRGITWTKK